MKLPGLLWIIIVATGFTAAQNWIYVSNTGMEYQLIAYTQASNHTKLQDYCTPNSNFRPRTADIARKVIERFKTQFNYSARIWVGIYKNGTVWQDRFGKVVTPGLWRQGQPQRGTQRAFIYLNTITDLNIQWSSTRTFNPFLRDYFICQRRSRRGPTLSGNQTSWLTDPKTGKTYTKGGYTFDLAPVLTEHLNEVCQTKFGGYLPEPRNEHENSFLSNFSNGGFLQLGIKKDNASVWVWRSDNTRAVFTNFTDPSERRGQDCAWLNHNRSAGGQAYWDKTICRQNSRSLLLFCQHACIFPPADPAHASLNRANLSTELTMTCKPGRLRPDNTTQVTSTCVPPDWTPDLVTLDTCHVPTPELISSSAQSELPLNTEVNLTCVSNPYLSGLKYSFYRGGQFILSSVSENVLTVLVRHDSEGQYTCVTVLNSTHESPVVSSPSNVVELTMFRGPPPECDCGIHECNQTVDDFVCLCRYGYINTSPKSCKDINECENKEHHTCEGNECVNEPGTYRCICLNEDDENVNGKLCAKKIDMGPDKNRGINSIEFPDDIRVVSTVVAMSFWVIGFLWYVGIMDAVTIINSIYLHITTESLSDWEDTPEDLTSSKGEDFENEDIISEEADLYETVVSSDESKELDSTHLTDILSGSSFYSGVSFVPKNISSYFSSKGKLDQTRSADSFYSALSSKSRTINSKETKSSRFTQ